LFEYFVIELKYLKSACINFIISVKKIKINVVQNSHPPIFIKYFNFEVINILFELKVIIL